MYEYEFKSWLDDQTASLYNIYSYGILIGKFKLDHKRIPLKSQLAGLYFFDNVTIDEIHEIIRDIERIYL